LTAEKVVRTVEREDETTSMEVDQERIRNARSERGRFVDVGLDVATGP
jgi:hypothetical protein